MCNIPPPRPPNPPLPPLLIFQTVLPQAKRAVQMSLLIVRGPSLQPPTERSGSARARSERASVKHARRAGGWWTSVKKCSTGACAHACRPLWLSCSSVRPSRTPLPPLSTTRTRLDRTSYAFRTRYGRPCCSLRRRLPRSQYPVWGASMPVTPDCRPLHAGVSLTPT